MRGRDIHQSTVEDLKRIFVDILRGSYQRLDNPHALPPKTPYKMTVSLAILDYGELDGYYGYWTEDDLGDEVFLSEARNVF